MQAEDVKKPEATGWRHRIAAGLYESGLLRAFHAASQRYEYARENGGGERLRRVRKAKYLVLGYHSVGEHGFPLYCRLPRTVFEAQMRHITRLYRVVSLRQMVEELRDPGAQGQGVAVTFDDGYLGTYTDAFPVLKEYGIPATVYLTAGAVESGEIAWYDRIFLRFQRAGAEVTVALDAEKTFRLTDFASRVEAATTVVMYLRTLGDDERRHWCQSFEGAIPVPQAELCGSMMSWQQVKEMQRAGIAIGCHTMTHPVLSRLAPDALQREVGHSKELIESRLEAAVEDFAFPFGKPRDCGTLGARPLSALGFRTAITTIQGVNGPHTDLFRLRRMVQGDELSVAMFAWRLQRSFFHPVDEELTSASVAAGA